jgi:MoaA/NifB/PqqE/SkfB family radical SAM enzyme
VSARQPPRVAGDPRLLRLFTVPHCALAITTRCQQRCRFCFEGEHGAGRDLPLADVAALLEQARELVTGVVFMGAESTLHRDFVAVVERATALGLLAMVSTNLLRFADPAFVAACVAAGLTTVELSFHHPDAEAFARLTRTRDHNFDRLLRAMENLDAACRPPGSPLLGANVNVVIHRENVDRLEEVVEHLERHLGRAFALLTWKLLQTTVSGAAGRRVDPYWTPDPEAMRRSLVRLLEQWAPTAVPLFRAFPLCVAPGFAHLNADLGYHCRRTPLFHNFDRPDTLSRMYDYEPAPIAAGIPPACDGCTLRALCLKVTRGQAANALPGLRPAPSSERPRDVLAGCGLGADEAAEFITRCETEAAGSPGPRRPAA